ncbi:hypothetical protein ACFSJ3_10245 [Corallincola platygyrae]|uniref:Uncharacterized protein n=1 Tax=Corallincola platygyrae TaxID=1193278 RepID=A0ABW4XMM6_9GAMM
MRTLSIYCLSLLFCSAVVAAEPWLPLSYAEQPTRGFNRLISESDANQETWVKDSDAVILEYLGAPDEVEVISKQGDNQLLEVTLMQPLNRAGVESALYLLQLSRTESGTWQLKKARMAWRCVDQGRFDTRRCQDAY